MKPLPEAQATVPALLRGCEADDVAASTPRLFPLPIPALALLSDERLARLASVGDRAAFGAIFHRYHKELHRYCVSILRNAEDAGDALQSTMLRALNALEGDTRDIALRPWLHRIAHNESVTLLRRHRRAEVGSELTVPDPLDGEAAVELRAQLHELLGDLRELPERQRGALIMRELAGFTYSEIGAVLGTTAAGAKQATYDARRALHEQARGRAMDCDLVCSSLSGGDGRALRGRALRAHLRACGDCRDFRRGVADRRSRLAALAPVAPAGLLEAVLGGAGGGGVSGAGLLTGFGASAALKSLTGLAVVAALGAGALDAIDPGAATGPGAGRHGAGSGSAVEIRPAPATRPSSSALPRRATLRAPGARPGPGANRRVHPGQGADHARPTATSAAPGPAETRRSGRGTETATADQAQSAPRPRPSLRHPFAHSSDRHPIRQTVGVVSHAALPSLPDVPVALPVRVPPLPLHP